MKKRNTLIAIHIAVPTLFVFILAFTAFSASDELFTKGLILNSLLIYYPILFRLQGSASYLLKANIFLSLGLSITMFIIVLIIWLNSSATIYIFAYFIIGLIGYSATMLVQKVLTIIQIRSK